MAVTDFSCAAVPIEQPLIYRHSAVGRFQGTIAELHPCNQTGGLELQSGSSYSGGFLI